MVSDTIPSWWRRLHTKIVEHELCERLPRMRMARRIRSANLRLARGTTRARAWAKMSTWSDRHDLERCREPIAEPHVEAHRQVDEPPEGPVTLVFARADHRFSSTSP
jgi:hypothetical protein